MTAALPVAEHGKGFSSWLPGRLTTATKTTVAIINYSFCSGGMLIFNKLAMHHLPYPSLVSTIQFAVCSLVVKSLKEMGVLEVDDLVWSKIKPFMVYNVVFVLSIYANMKALEGSNVDTVIVFRSCVPLAVSLLDRMFMGRALPNLRSLIALTLILLGAAGYVNVDSAFILSGWSTYTWCFLWVAMLCFLMVFGKRMMDQVGMQAMMGHVYYSNSLSVLPMILLGIATGESQQWRSITPTMPAALFLALSCIAGIGLSYTGWLCRDLLSATSYTLVGAMCKILPIAINAVMWDRHASALGIAFLLVCLFGGTVYQQAPLLAELELEKDTDEEEEDPPMRRVNSGNALTTSFSSHVHPLTNYEPSQFSPQARPHIQWHTTDE